MRKLGIVVLVGFALLVAPVAYAQMVDQSGQGGNGSVATEAQQGFGDITGKIVSLDFANGTLTLDNGEQFTLEPNLEYTSAPALGQEVDVMYVVQDGKKVIRSINVGGDGN